MLVNRFMQLKFIWDAEHNLMIRKSYNHYATKRLQQMMSNVHQGYDHLTKWIRQAIKNELEGYFRDNERFKCHRLMNVSNRAPPRSSKYTGGSTIFMQTKSKLSLDRKATLVETFKYTYILKANKKRFADEQSVAYYEDYMQKLEAATQQSQAPSGDDEVGSETSVVDPDRVWRQTASELYKNGHFGLGSFFASGFRSFALAASSATSPADPQEVVDLKEEVYKLTQELHQQVEQFEQRYNNLLACVGGAVAISSDLTEKLE
ncbi:hypothetical protein Ahy_A03g015770 [Arachis hypogaea]|uniref:Uncharacterized protein n=1 Tax=Arachis hypogaea TaxID=3818 RepID=A0A445E175_ARAHY|nr:hypothetical protein Ahy_A03g015770 [Arachis hypogaea]